MNTAINTAMLKSANTRGYNDSIEKEMVGRARELAPLLLRSAPQADKDRRLSAEVFDALTDAGFWAMAAPRRWGGLGTSATAMARVGAELAKGDPSVGWVYTVLHGTTWVASLGPDALQEAIFGSSKEHPLICGVANPPGIAERVEGGWMVNGRWPYSSGSRHASWAQLGVKLNLPDGAVQHGAFAYLRNSQYTIEDTWFMMGMKGTGSETIVAKNVFIPDAQLYHFAKVGGIGGHTPGKRHVGEPSDYWPFMPFLRATAHAVAGGAALAILERVAEASKRRPIIYTTYTRQVEAVMAQGEFGQAAAKIQAAQALVLKTCEAVDRAGLTGVPMTPQERAQSKGEGSLTVDLIAQAVDQLMFLAGSGAFAETNPLERFYRDVVFSLRHTANLPYVGYEIYGKDLLGIEPNIAHPDFI
jgi:alkylation response protein AidB-like acyl-CoA dehydrogenase